MTRACSAVTFSELLHLLFTLNSVDFMMERGGRVPSYATALHVVPSQCLGYAAKQISGLDYWVQLLLNFTPMSVHQV